TTSPASAAARGDTPPPATARPAAASAAPIGETPQEAGTAPHSNSDPNPLAPSRSPRRSRAPARRDPTAAAGQASSRAASAALLPARQRSTNASRYFTGRRSTCSSSAPRNSDQAASSAGPGPLPCGSAAPRSGRSRAALAVAPALARRA